MTSIIAMSTILRGTAPSRTRTLMSTISSATAMCTFRTFIIGTVTDGLRALAIASFAAGVCAAPYVPKDDTTVLERLPVRPGDPVARELRQLRAELTANPRKRETAVRLAERYFALATSEGDPRYVGYAQAALKPWWDLPAPPLDVLVMRAILKQYSHDFSGAMRDLDTATLEDPKNARAWSWRALPRCRCDRATRSRPSSISAQRTLNRSTTSFCSRPTRTFYSTRDAPTKSSHCSSTGLNRTSCSFASRSPNRR